MEFKQVPGLGSGSDLLGKDMPVIEGFLLVAFIVLAFVIFAVLTDNR
ncbi:MAG: hypothetical protein AAGB15_15625 [Pseudomonadota bacterium]